MTNRARYADAKEAISDVDPVVSSLTARGSRSVGQHGFVTFPTDSPTGTHRRGGLLESDEA
jgi:hypothetical protein